MKSSASESKPFQSCSKVAKFPAGLGEIERLSRSNLKQAYLFTTNAELFMFGDWTGPKEKVSFDYVRDAQSVDRFQELQDLANSNPQGKRNKS